MKFWWYMGDSKKTWPTVLHPLRAKDTEGPFHSSIPASVDVMIWTKATWFNVVVKRWEVNAEKKTREKLVIQSMRNNKKCNLHSQWLVLLDFWMSNIIHVVKRLTTHSHSKSLEGHVTNWMCNRQNLYQNKYQITLPPSTLPVFSQTKKPFRFFFLNHNV